MPTNQRPFLSNFLAAFRAHSAVSHGKATSANPSSSQPSHTTTHTSSSSTSTPSNPRTITTKTGATTAALSTLHSPRNVSTSPLSLSPGTEPLNIGGDRGGSERGGVANGANRGYWTEARNRRESDSSSEGFRDVLGAEKWYIGGRTAAGEERCGQNGDLRSVREDKAGMVRNGVDGIWKATHQWKVNTP
ncbi:hypothetical protein B0O99DRAFT_598960 [Bisporella sp. PMI_857]|nr:hypothetical protein B0O99DRAFT_598960 [Bisporella sp. PMI_857]